MSEKSMLAAADTLKALRDEKTDLQAKLKEVQESIDAVEAELIQYMTDEECTGFDRNGSRFSLVIREFPGAVPEEKEELYHRMRALASTTCSPSTPRPLAQRSRSSSPTTTMCCRIGLKA